MGITSEYSRTLPVIVRAALEDMRKKLPADKISSTKEFLTRLIDFVEMNKLKSNFKTSKMRLAYVDCLKSNLPGNRFSDLETLVYLVDMIPDRLDLARLLPTLSERKLGDEDDVKYVDKGGRTKRLSNAQVCSSGSSSSSEGGVRPGTWVLSV